MRKGLKITYIVAAALLLAGIALAVTAFAMSGWSFSGLSTKTSYVEKTFTAEYSDFNSISVDDTDRPIELTASNDNLIHVTYYENEREFYEITQNDGKLSFKFRTNKKWYEYISLNFNLES
jgi:hypothetical protein